MGISKLWRGAVRSISRQLNPRPESVSIHTCFLTSDKQQLLLGIGQVSTLDSTNLPVEMAVVSLEAQHQFFALTAENQESIIDQMPSSVERAKLRLMIRRLERSACPFEKAYQSEKPNRTVILAAGFYNGTHVFLVNETVPVIENIIKTGNDRLKAYDNYYGTGPIVRPRARQTPRVVPTL